MSVDHATGIEAGFVADAMRGDREAMRRLWDEHRRWLAAVLIAHKPASADLDDLLQDVAMTFVARIHELREHGNLRAWLRTVAVNTARASARSAGVRRIVATETDAAAHCALHLDGCAAAEHAVKAGMDEESARVLELAARLPEAYREPLLLRALQGLKYEEIAQTLDIPATTIETRIARARRMLRELAAAPAGDEQCVSGQPA